jgi:hypothetical protein
LAGSDSLVVPEDWNQPSGLEEPNEIEFSNAPEWFGPDNRNIL